jgi:hypothetical protein
MRISFGVAALLSAPAFAAENTLPTDEQAATSELAAAAARAEVFGEQRWAFTAAYEDLAAAGRKPLKLRFDPRLPAGARWTPIEPAENALSKEERKSLKKLRGDDDADRALVYDDLDEAIKDASVLRLSEDQALFRISIDDPEMPAEMKGALEATAHLDRDGGLVTTIEVRSTRPFKPAAVAKIESMRQTQRYALVAPGGAPLLVASESQVTGKAMLKSFSSSVRVAYSDFQAVDAPPRTKKD